MPAALPICIPRGSWSTIAIVVPDRRHISDLRIALEGEWRAAAQVCTAGHHTEKGIGPGLRLSPEAIAFLREMGRMAADLWLEEKRQNVTVKRGHESVDKETPRNRKRAGPTRRSR